MADIDLKAATPDTSLPSTGFLFGADSQSATAPSVYSTQTVATALLGSTSLTGATITTSQPVLNLSQTWDALGVTFTGLKFNATDTRSSSSSLLCDFQVGNASKASIDKFGSVNAVAVNVSGTYSVNMANNSARFRMGASSDVILTRRDAANLRLGDLDAAAPIAQTLSVQSPTGSDVSAATYPFRITGAQGTGLGAGGPVTIQIAPATTTGSTANPLYDFAEFTSTRRLNLYNTTDTTTNYERGKISWESNVLRIGTEKAGTGTTARALELQTDGTTRLTITSGGDITVANNITVTSSAKLGGAQSNQFAYDIRLTSDTFVNYARLRVNASDKLIFYNGAGNGAPILQIGGETSSFPSFKRNSTDIQVRLADDSGYTTIDAQLRLQGSIPASATATGTAGDVRYESGYLYVCTATNTWQRVAIATW